MPRASKRIDWWTRPFAVLDFETTGIDPLEARAISVSYKILDAQGEPAGEGLDSLIQPYVPIPTEASDVHGITAEKLKDAPGSQDVLGRLVDLLNYGADVWDRPLVIFNVRYDWTLLHAECRRHRLKAPRAATQLLDPTIIDRTLDKYRRGSRKLIDMARHYGVSLEDAHSADADAIATAGIMRELILRYPSELQVDPKDLQARQAVWFEKWRDGINRYWQREGIDKRVEGTWPLFDPQPDLFAP